MMKSTVSFDSIDPELGWLPAQQSRMNSAPAIVHVVDDDASVCAALQRLLRAAGFETRTYASAGEFLVAPPVNGPQCLVLDVHMPGTSGFDLQAVLARSGHSLPIIFVSGRADVPARVRAMNAGAVDFLTKPVESCLLFAAVNRALSREAKAPAGREDLRNRQQF